MFSFLWFLNDADRHGEGGLLATSGGCVSVCVLLGGRQAIFANNHRFGTLLKPVIWILLAGGGRVS